MSQPEVPVADDARPVGSSVILDCLKRGWADFVARPTVGIMLIVLYPVIGLIIFRVTFDLALFPLLFPLASGFALVGPIAAMGFYEISRRRESREPLDPEILYRRLTAGEFGPAILVGLVLLAINLAWLGSAMLLYRAIMPPFDHGTYREFAAAVLTTPEGWLLFVLGCGVGLVFALAVLAVGTFSVPAIVDRSVGAGEAIRLSVRAFRSHTGLVLGWGAVVAAGLVVGSIPAFVGLLIVLPVLGHATWHLYRHLFPATTLVRRGEWIGPLHGD